MLASLSLKKKLLALVFMMAAFLLVVGVGGNLALTSVGNTYGEVAGTVLPNVQSTLTMERHFRQVRIELRTLGIPGLTEKEYARAVEATLASVEAYDKEAKYYEGIPFAQGEAELYEPAKKEWESFKKLGAHVLELAKSNRPEDRAAMTAIFVKDCPEAAGAYSRKMEALLAYHKKMAETAVQAAESSEVWAGRISMGLMAAGTLLSLIVGVWFANYLANTLNAIAQQLRTGAESVAGSTQQISGVSEDLSSSTAQQAASLQQTSASVQEMSSMIAKTSDSAQRSTEIATSSREKAIGGSDVVKQMIEAMSDIEHSNAEIMNKVTSSNQEFAKVVRVIQDIGEKTKVINEIVFQTKLLSFNASVEAARAGEQGKGFAVVAEEVGNLAQMSGKAAKDISDMLEASIRTVEVTVRETASGIERLTAEGRQKVEFGASVARRCSDVLNDIVVGAGNASDMAADIAHASREQSVGVSEISKAVHQLDQATQTNARAAQQAAGTASNLANQADVLRGLVVNLVSVVEGQSGGSAPEAQAANNVISIHNQAA